MDAQQARTILLEALRQVASGGFLVGGHWDDSIVLLVNRNFPDVQPWSAIPNEIRYNEENYAEITVHDEDYQALWTR